MFFFFRTTQTCVQTLSVKPGVRVASPFPFLIAHCLKTRLFPSLSLHKQNKHFVEFLELQKEKVRNYGNRPSCRL